MDVTRTRLRATHRLMVLAGMILLACACGRKEGVQLETHAAPLAAPAETTAAPVAPAAPRGKKPIPAKLQGAPLDELAFVPSDVEAVVRVDLAQVGARSEHPAESLRTLDFLLRAQQPAAWQLLHQAGITVGKELSALYLVIGPPGMGSDAYLIVGLGRFDTARLGSALRGTDATVEPGPAPLGQTSAFFTWKHPSAGAVGALEQPAAESQDSRLGDAAVGLGDGILLFGPALLVRRALGSRAGIESDVRTGPLADEILAVDATATVWGVAQPGVPANRAWLATAVPGVKRGHFQAALASPGPDIDGLFTLRAEFASHDQAIAFGDRLRQLLQTIALLGEHSPLGRGFAKLKNGAVVKLEDDVVVASGAL